MKAIQKLEFYTGLASNLTLFSYLCVLVRSFGLVSEVTGNVHDGIVLLAIPWLFSFLVAAGAFIHSRTKSDAALIILCVGAGLVSLYLSFGFLILIWGAASLLGLIFLLLNSISIVLSIITVIFALIYRKYA